MTDSPLLHEPMFLGVFDPKYTSLENSHFVVLPVPYEFTTTYGKGTRYAPQSIINASYQVELFDEEFELEAWKELGVHTLSPFLLDTKPDHFLKELARFIESYKSKFIISLGGEHTISVGIVSALLKYYKKLSVLQIDAHADLRDRYLDSEFNHACVARRLMQFCKVIQVGVRSISEDEFKYCNGQKVRTFTMHKYRDFKRLIPLVLEELTDQVYITIDMDAFDPSLVPAVGTPVPGGILWYEMLDLLRAVIQEKEVISCDLTELCPIRDSNVSEFTAARLIYKIITYLTVKKKNTLKTKPRFIRVKK